MEEAFGYVLEPLLLQIVVIPTIVHTPLPAIIFVLDQNGVHIKKRIRILLKKVILPEVMVVDSSCFLQ